MSGGCVLDVGMGVFGDVHRHRVEHGTAAARLGTALAASGGEPRLPSSPAGVPPATRSSMPPGAARGVAGRPAKPTFLPGIITPPSAYQRGAQLGPPGDPTFRSER